MPEPFYKQSTLPRLITDQDLNTVLPKQIGPYKVESLLSAGGMSLLYLGLHPTTHIPLAIKVLSPHYAENEEMTKQFLHEAEIIALADHPNIVKLYGQGRWEGGLYIAMEFIQGISLRQFIVQHSLSLRRALDIILQVAYALLHLHTHGVIHRDLKPENILITETGQVKVIDFGIAQLKLERDKEAKLTVGGVIGTPSYMSPEQARNPRNVHFNSDIYSLAVVAYELIIGKLSFGTIQLSLLPPALRTIIEKALRPDPMERTQDIVDFITEISDYLKSTAIKSDRPGSDEIKEVWERLGQVQIKLLPALPGIGPDLDIGIARPANVLLFGLYYDIFRFANGNQLMLLAESKENSAEAMVYISTLRATIRTLLSRYLENPLPFDHSEFIRTLNRMTCADPIKQTFGLSSLYISLQEDRFGFISCGETPLWHLSQGAQTPRLLINRDPLLGLDPHHNFDETTDNWLEGDILLFHSFNNFFCSEQENRILEEECRKAILDYRDLSCQSQANAIFKRMHDAMSGPIEKQPKAIISIQRVV